MKKIKFDGDKVNYLLPSWNDLEEISFVLSKKIINDGLKFDRIVTLAKGGWPMTRSLVDFLKVSEVASIGVKFYSGIGERREKPEIYQKLPIDVKGEKILLFDDVADTGESLIFTKDYLKLIGVAEVKTATIFWKPKSKIEPDYWGEITSDWIIFPFEVREMIDLLGEKWKKMGISDIEIRERFLKMDLKEEWIEFFVRKLEI